MATFTPLHDWKLTPSEAVQKQRELAARVLIEAPENGWENWRLIAGCDISFDKFAPTLFAGICVLRLPDLETVEEVGIEAQVSFPYIPGLLSFREIPSLLQAWQKLQCQPDAVMFDGQGIAHPRRIGIASHAGLILDLPCVGCAKTKLVGEYSEPEKTRGSWSPITHRGETIGAALRTKNNTKEMFISPGHKMDLPTAIELTLACCTAYRMPEPTRRAHLLVNALRRGERATNS